ncbi:MAG: YihA family ribosome biogenesis GTP-binding protein [Firmicutes bacterium]|nr:YihA family ribosome biogenesis GTP-binding protein [Bacillota bacterium]
MEIKKADFVISAVNHIQYPQDILSHVAMVGKSNVGKSSLINAMTHQNKLARVSSEPGKTRLINFFLINDGYYLVDLPGYGFARVSKGEKSKWGDMINEYFDKAHQLKLIILIVDIRHTPTGEDLQMAEWIRHYEIPVIIAASKSDKLGKTRVKPQASKIREQLGFTDQVPVVPYSVLSRRGINDILNLLDEYIVECRPTL